MSPFSRLVSLLSLCLSFTAFAHPVQQQQPPRPRIQLTFVLDTTGSMGGLLEGAKQKIFSIASRIAQGRPSPQLEVALVAYRDVGDEYVTRRYDFSGDLDTVFSHLRSFEASGGGDTPEHVGRGLGEAVSLLKWDERRETMKLIFLVGDAPPAQRQDDWQFMHWAKRAAAKNIVVNTVRCGQDADTEVAWLNVAKLTNGSYDTIDANGGMLAVVTPYDAELTRINKEIASRTLYAGSARSRAENKARSDAAGALAPEAAAERAGYLKASRGGGAAASSAPAPMGGAQDLAAEPAQLAKTKEDDLPSELRSMKPAEREAQVQKLAKERKALEEEASRVLAKREAWRVKNAPAKKDAFDTRVMDAVKTQAKGFGVTY